MASVHVFRGAKAFLRLLLGDRGRRFIRLLSGMAGVVARSAHKEWCPSSGAVVAMASAISVLGRGGVSGRALEDKVRGPSGLALLVVHPFPQKRWSQRQQHNHNTEILSFVRGQESQRRSAWVKAGRGMMLKVKRG